MSNAEIKKIKDLHPGALFVDGNGMVLALVKFSKRDGWAKGLCVGTLDKEVGTVGERIEFAPLTEVRQADAVDLARMATPTPKPAANVLACPQCARSGPFQTVGLFAVTVNELGLAVEMDGLGQEPEDMAQCVCPHCGYNATVRDFRIANQTA